MEDDVQLAEIFYRKQMSHSAFISSQIVIALQAIDLAGSYSSGTDNRTILRFFVFDVSIVN